ncbi:MAG: magnesium-translocating P-type ATPase [Candidatus Kerfeldbacteria bacterium]|nr:magnesium-translocating P-type ATPase [Candidatus Kerfeldbacteria bacterium]
MDTENYSDAALNLFHTCQTSPAGLTGVEAERRLQQYGPNTVAQKRKMRPLVAFVKKFNSPLLLILIVASVISFLTGGRVNAGILMVMVLLSVVLDFINTYRSERAVEGLIAKVVTTTTVIRDGKKQEVPLAQVVRGEIIFLSAGDVIPADARIVSANDFFLNQSAVTGESMPVAKNMTRGGNPAAVRAEQIDSALMGTSVVSGYGTAVVVATGADTVFGRIAAGLNRGEEDTDFERGIRQFSLFIMRITFFLVAFVFVINAAFNRGWLESFLFAVAIAIGLTPELLPVIISVSLSRGAVRMSRQQVIVKHLPAIQNFGRMNILCTDKTGTLTKNEIKVVQCVDPFGHDDEEVLHQAYLNSFYHTGVFHPLEQAVRQYKTWDMAQVKKIDEIPFDFERRRESMVVEISGQREMITTGAPEAILPICSSYRSGGTEASFDQAHHAQASQEFFALSQDGLKVLAVAVKHVASQPNYEKDMEQAMTLIGFIAFLDPPKTSVKATLDELEERGIEIKILTGDNARLTEKICRDIGLVSKGSMTGEELAALPHSEVGRAVVGHTIFARIDPEQKEEIIRSLQQQGNVVGFLGDGINDAPALKIADVGISVNNAVDVAKETADIILLRHSLRVLKDGVIEGRKTFQNTLKYIMMGLSSNFGNMFSMTVASAFLPFLPMLPTQILLNNFLYDLSQITLSTDAVDDDDVIKPTSWNIHFIRRFMLVFGPLSSIFDFITFGALLLIFHLHQSQFQTGWFMESLATQILVIYIIRTKKTALIRSRPSGWVVASTLAVLALAWGLPFLPLSQHVFHLQPSTPTVLLAISGIVLVYLLLVEMVKHWFYRRWQAHPAAAS